MTPSKPGIYVFSDAIGAPPLALEVRFVHGELVALFPAEDGEPAVALGVQDMAGDWSPLTYRFATAAPPRLPPASS